MIIRIICCYDGHGGARLFAVNPFILRCVRCDNLPRREGNRERERERERPRFFADADEQLISQAFSSDRFGIENGLDRAISLQYHLKSTRDRREESDQRMVTISCPTKWSSTVEAKKYLL